MRLEIFRSMNTECHMFCRYLAPLPANEESVDRSEKKDGKNYTIYLTTSGISVHHCLRLQLTRTVVRKNTHQRVLT
jgi:hypothetical protein